MSLDFVIKYKSDGATFSMRCFQISELVQPKICGPYLTIKKFFPKEQKVTGAQSP